MAAARMTKDAVIAQASTLKFAYLLILVIGLPAAVALAQPNYYQQQQAYQQQQQQQMYQQQLAGQYYQQQQQQQQQRQQQEQQYRDQQQAAIRQSNEQWQQQQSRNRQEDELRAQQRQSQSWQEQQDQQERQRRLLDDISWPAQFGDDQAASAPEAALHDDSQAPLLDDTQSAQGTPRASIQRQAVWPIAAVLLLLLGLSSVAVVTLVLLNRRRASQLPVDSATNSIGPSFENATLRLSDLMSGVSTRLSATMSKLQLSLRDVIRRTGIRLRRMIPSRRTVFRASCLLIGGTLVILSLVGFTRGRILESSILLPIGYAVATSWWLLLWIRPPQGPDDEEIQYLAANRLRHSTAVARPLDKSASRIVADKPTPMPASRFTFDIVDRPHLPTHFPKPAFAKKPTADDAVRLQCNHCEKQFSVRGQGEIAYRLVPCPECGSAMNALGPIRTDIIPNDPNWVPIVSVLCKKCCGLIDVPYSTFGTSVPCPRCQADLHVPCVAS